MQLMTKGMRVALCAVFLVGLALPARAGWVDDWVAQKSETSPGYFQGQKRGYFSGGSFSARWNLQNDYLWSITPPRLKAGCGGIDMFLGGFSFLNADYLVQKLQRIMSAAPAAAFDIALKVYAPQISDTISKFESIVDRLNNIQLNECKASKALVATIAKPFTPSTQKQGELSNIQADWWQSTGAGDLWDEFQQERKADNDKPDASIATATMAGCSTDFKKIFASGSVLNQSAALLGITNTDYLKLIRGYVGDIYINPPNSSVGAYKVVYVRPCDQDQDKGLEDLLNGTAMGKDVNGQCTTISDADRNLTHYVQQEMMHIAAALEGKSSLSAADEAFIEASPLSTDLTLKNAVATGTQAQIIAELSDVTAKAYAYSLLGDMYAKAMGIFNVAKSVASASAGPTSGNSTTSCRIGNVQEAIQDVDAIEGRLYKLMAEVRNEYQVTVTELNTIDHFVQRQKDFNDEAFQKLQQQFGKSLATRETS